MKRQLPKPFKFLLFFFFLSNYVWATPECPIITGTFPLANGTTSDPSATGWYLDASHVQSTGYFAVKSNRIMAQTLGGEGIWYSRVFSTAGYSSFQAAVKITAEGLEDNTEYAKIYYIIDGGPLTLLDQRTGNWGTIDFTSGILTGSTIQLVVKLYNYNHGTQASKYYIEQYRVFKEKGPCSVSAITVTPSAGNGGVLTCAHPSLSLGATATGSGTTTWSWSGPNGFTSSAQSPSISTAGTYTVTASNSTGTGSASITVTANQSGPAVTATGGSVGCGSSLTLGVTSSAGSSIFSWTGPNSFNSSAQNPTVTTPGTYTVTVTDPTNGCSTTQSVTVTAGTAASTIWLEDFTGLANGTTSDNGLTAWTATTTGTGTYSVQNGEFKTSFSGQTEGVWTSQAIDISNKTNVTFSVDLRSETASSGDAFETADYVRVYYVLNGGTPVLAYEDLAGIGTSTTGTSSFTFNSATLNGSTLQIIIKTNDSDPTERYFFDNIKVSGSAIGGISATATAGNIITCTNTSATLLGSSGTSGVTYSWTGPNNYTSAVQNPVVTTPGIYTLVVNSTTGCSGTDTALVSSNTTAPGVSADNGGAITCRNVSVSITGTVSASGASYSWIGPNGFTSSALSTTVTKGGTYTLTATDPTNGCSGSAATVVAENTVVPGNLSISNTATITCLTNSIVITGSSSTPGVNYSWAGPNGYTASSASATIMHGGLYTLTATDPVNGCNGVKSTTVAENTAVPAVTIGNTSPLSCSNPTVTLTANSTTPNAGYLWIGPDDFIDVVPVTTVTEAGSYVLTVTDPVNGCTNTLTTDVTGSPNCAARKVTGSTSNTPAATAVTTFTHSAYPNPVTANGVIQFTSPSSTTVSVGIYNTLGACEKVLFKGTATANQQYKLSVLADQLHAGAYYYIINTNGKVYTGKLVIVK